MIGKSLGGLGVLGLGMAYFSGALASGYSRDVSRPLPVVMAALEDLDVRKGVGAPGTDPSRSGGVRALFKLERTADSMTWTVMSGDQVATRMIAHFASIDNGTHTRVTTEVQRGNAPDDFVAPAFRSTGLTKGLFAMALDGQIDQLVTPGISDPRKCEELIAQFESGGVGGAPGPHGDDRSTLGRAVASTARDVMRISAMDAELRRNGCKTNNNDGEFRPVSSQMGHAAEMPVQRSYEPSEDRPGDDRRRDEASPVDAHDRSEWGGSGPDAR